MLRLTDATIFFFRKNRLHVAIMIGIYDTRVKSFEQWTELKRETGQAPRKLINANQFGRNNNHNAGPKRHYKCTKVKYAIVK